MARFQGLRGDLPATPAAPQGRPSAVQEGEGASAKSARSRSREGKKGILGHFSPELSRTLNIMAVEEGSSVQALMGEAFDLLLRSRGKHPFNER